MIYIDEIRKWVNKKINQKRVISFIPAAIVKELNIPEDVAIKECKNLVDEGLLKIQYDLVCPNCISCLETADTIPELKEVPECIYCGEKDIDKSNAAIRFVLVR